MNKNVIWALVILLAALHQDFWWWDDPKLLFGFLPIGLGYHALYSVLAAGVWALAIKFAWPSDVEAFAEGDDAPVEKDGSAS